MPSRFQHVFKSPGKIGLRYVGPFSTNFALTTEFE